MDAQIRLLGEVDGAPVSIINAQGRGNVVLVCEHASRLLPRSLGTLGLAQEALNAHIAWDPGALAISKMLSVRLDSILIFQNFSRLAYDCNRPPHAVDAMPELSEIYEIPGNAGLTSQQRQQRVDEIYRPFQTALRTLVKDRQAAGSQTVLVTIHSFTPIYRGVAREVEIGILHDVDGRLADEMLIAGHRSDKFVVLRNQPYGPQDGVTHTLKEHGLANGLLNVMIEVRNDLITTEDGQRVMADFLARLIEQSLTELEKR